MGPKAGCALKKLRFMVLAALLAMLLGATAAYWMNPQAPVEVIDAGESPAAAAKHKGPRVLGLDYTQVKDGKREWTLFARTARMNEKAHAFVLDQVMMAFYADDGGKITVEGKTGTYMEKRKLVSLAGDVKARTHDGIVLLTDRVRYSEDQKILRTNAPVTITGPRFSIKSKGMVVDVTRKHVTFLEQVHTTFIPSGDGPPAGTTVDDS